VSQWSRKRVEGSRGCSKEGFWKRFVGAAGWFRAVVVVVAAVRRVLVCVVVVLGWVS
jgi:hypothetical protein